MLEFFLALFGGAYYGTKISAEKASWKAFEQSSEERLAWHKARQTAWAEQVCDKALEENLARFIADPRNYDAVWREVQSAYSQMPSRKVFTKILLSEPMVAARYGKSKYTKKQRENIAAASCRDALDIMLARRGKVRSPQVSYMDTIVTMSPGNGQHTQALWDMNFDFVVYLRDALRENEVNARPVFMTGLFGGETESTAYDIEDADKFRYQAGRFVWLPVTHYNDNLLPV